MLRLPAIHLASEREGGQRSPSVIDLRPTSSSYFQLGELSVCRASPGLAGADPAAAHRRRPHFCRETRAHPHLLPNKKQNQKGFVSYAGENFALLLPSKWNPSKERDFAGVVLRYEDNFDAVNNLVVIEQPAGGKSKIEDFGAPDKFLESVQYLLGQQVFSGAPLVCGVLCFLCGFLVLVGVLSRRLVGCRARAARAHARDLASQQQRQKLQQQLGAAWLGATRGEAVASSRAPLLLLPLLLPAPCGSINQHHRFRRQLLPCCSSATGPRHRTARRHAGAPPPLRTLICTTKQHAS